jgi:hypothetical protein
MKINIFYKLTIIALALISAYFIFKPRAENNGLIACTAEAKLCPDGSYVGRTGPKCEFTECPSISGTQKSSGIKGTVLLGPTCPVMRIPPDPQCADKKYATTLAVTNIDGAQIIKQFSSDANGIFSVILPPGEYEISRAATSNIYPNCRSNGTIKVSAGTFTETMVYCDTGIR